MAAAAAARPLRLRLRAVALVGALAYAVLVARHGGGWSGGLLVVGLGGVLALGVGAAPAVALGLGALALETIIAFGSARTAPAGAAFAGTALLVIGEAAALAGEIPAGAAVHPGALRPRLRRLAGLGGAGFLLSVACLLLGGAGVDVDAWVGAVAVAGVALVVGRTGG
jgi:hypothetical protein